MISCFLDASGCWQSVTMHRRRIRQHKKFDRVPGIGDIIGGGRHERREQERRRRQTQPSKCGADAERRPKRPLLLTSSSLLNLNICLASSPPLWTSKTSYMLLCTRRLPQCYGRSYSTLGHDPAKVVVNVPAGAQIYRFGDVGSNATPALHLKKGKGWQIREGETWAVIGTGGGSGKTTLFKVSERCWFESWIVLILSNAVDFARTTANISYSTTASWALSFPGDEEPRSVSVCLPAVVCPSSSRRKRVLRLQRQVWCSPRGGQNHAAPDYEAAWSERAHVARRRTRARAPGQVGVNFVIGPPGDCLVEWADEKG